MRQQSNTSGHQGDPHSPALVPFRNLLSEIQLEERLGAGAGGTTWKCRWRTATVAIKLLVSTSVDQLRASTREAVCSRIVSHPCVVQCYAINIAQLTEQDMDLLTAAATPPAPNRGGTGGGDSGVTCPQAAPPLVCLGSSPPLALGGAGTQGSGGVQGLLQQSPPPPPPQQPQYGHGWLLASEAASTQQRQERCKPEGGGAAASAAVGEAAAAAVAAAAGRRSPGGLDGAAAIAAPDAAAALAAGDTASAPPLAPAAATRVGGAAGHYPAGGQLLLLQAAAGAALSDRFAGALTPIDHPTGKDDAEADEEPAARATQDYAADAVEGGRSTPPLLMLREQSQASPPQPQPPSLRPPLDCGSAPAVLTIAAAAVVSGPADGVAAEARPSSMNWWHDASESLLLEVDPGDQAAALREELLRLGAAPGKFLTTIIMEWCDGGTLHDEFTSCQASHPRHPGLRHSGLASGHLLRGLGPTTYSPLGASIGGTGTGAGSGDPTLPRSSRVSDQAGSSVRRGGGGGTAGYGGYGGYGGGGGGGPGSGSHPLCCPAYQSESAAGVTTSGVYVRALTIGGGSAASPRSLPIFLRNSVPSSPLYASGGGGSAAAAASCRSGQQPRAGHRQAPPQQHSHPCRQSGQLPSSPPPPPPAPLGAAVPFGSFVVPPRAQGPTDHHPQSQCQSRPLAASAPAAPVAVAVSAFADRAGDGGGGPGGAGGGGCASSSSFVSVVGCNGRTAVLLRCALEVAQGMSYLHSLNLAHGDLTPKNVLLKSTATSRRGFTCKISDFGLSNPTSTGNCLPADTSRWGTLLYMAPEILTGRGTLKQADVYSFGAVLWHMCTGRPPHQELRPAQVLVGLATGDLQLTWPDWVDPGVVRIGKACMDPDPAKRPVFEEIVRLLLAEITARSRSARRRAAGPAEGAVRRGSASYGGGVAAMTAPPPLPPGVSSASSSPILHGIGAYMGGAVAAGSPVAGLPTAASAAAAAATAAAAAGMACTESLRPHPGPLNWLQQQQQQQGLACPPHRQPQRPPLSGSAAARCCEWQPVAQPAPARDPSDRARVVGSLAAALAPRGEAASAGGAHGGSGGGGGGGTTARVVVTAAAAAAARPAAESHHPE